jgi:hypothetical protein
MSAPYPSYMILSHRYANRDLDYLFRREHVERVEVVMKETDDCKGRTGFYDAYGVLRDVHQNHLTQMAVGRHLLLSRLRALYLALSFGLYRFCFCSCFLSCQFRHSDVIYLPRCW